ncbi:MAG: PstS family phosphate ABC transporter substrate-binding protein [Dehalococcoidia bacterium]|nr:MAG: PstS family phosphate ABC transporter substrate-binding protein [Dehalococcoidia bacterium]
MTIGTRWKRLLPVAVTAALATGLVACGAGDSGPDATQTGKDGTPAAATATAAASVKEARAKLGGEIVGDGSSTVFPITAAAAEEFRKQAKDVKISVGIAGTGGGFKKFCSGETDLQDASRPITPSEVDACKAKNIDYIELPVAFDGLAVVVSSKNTFLSCITVAELKKMWEPEAQGKVTRWNQVNPKWPDQPIKLFGPGADSGTFDYFTEAINGKAKASRGDYQASEDDNVLVKGVSDDQYAVGYFGLAYYEENASKLKLIAVDAKGDGKCVTPTVATVKDGSYQPLSRPLFIYVKKSVADRPEVKAFVEFYLSKEFTPKIQSREVGYITLEDNLYAASAKRFAAGTTGTLFPKGAEVGATLERYLK